MTVTDRPAVPAAEPARVRKFDRPPPPHDWRWWVGGLGRVLIAVGILMFGFVAYQLWGTGIETARAQASLENEFEELLAAAPAAGDETPATADGSLPDEEPTDETTSDAAASDDVTSEGAGSGEDAPVDTADDAELPVFAQGDPIARIEIPRIGVDDIVVSGVDKGDLKKGPGHYPGTPMPGQLGNAAIAGHRTTYGQPFHDVDKLEDGDEIVVTTLNGRYVYRVTGQRIVSPSDYHVIATTDPERATITLTSCHPKWTTNERIIISADLDPTASPEPTTAAVDDGREADAGADPATADATGDAATADDTAANGATNDDVTGDGETAGDGDASTGDATPAAAGAGAAVEAEIADAFSDGWFSDDGAFAQVALWGLALSAVAVGAYLLSRRFKRDVVGLAIGLVPFVVALYFFFQNVNRLLPPAL